ncbi:MAG: hydroxyacid dehydrogenase [Proteobacteria bacterium]|nr:hydroxyacid dehydrogenase [Pseudomonadota bacterium]
MTIRILSCDDISSVGLGILRDHGYEVVARPGITPAELIKNIPDFDAVLVRSRTLINRAVIKASAGRLKLIGRAGYGMDRIDLAAAAKNKIAILHSPEGNAATAAEFTIGLLFSLARHIPRADAGMRAQRWDKRRYRGVEVSGKTLGVIGMGNVGREVVDRGVALGLLVKVHDPGKDPALIESIGAMSVSWDELLGSSDFITVHVSAKPMTRGLLGHEAFDRMKDGVRLINSSRGGVVDEAALATAIRSGRVAGAAIDVFDEEPPWGNPLLELPQVIVTPHLVASTFEAQIKVAVGLAEQVRDYFEGRPVHGLVGPDMREQD